MPKQPASGAGSVNAGSVNREDERTPEAHAFNLKAINELQEKFEKQNNASPHSTTEKPTTTQASTQTTQQSQPQLKATTTAPKVVAFNVNEHPLFQEQEKKNREVLETSTTGLSVQATPSEKGTARQTRWTEMTTKMIERINSASDRVVQFSKILPRLPRLRGKDWGQRE